MAKEKEKARILVVDDEKIVRDFLQRILEKAGYDVIMAADGQEALDKFSASRYKDARTRWLSGSGTHAKDFKCSRNNAHRN